MALEIERKWLVPEMPVFKERHPEDEIRQGYVVIDKSVALRVRTVVGRTYSGFITVKGPTEVPGVVQEHEMEVPFETADDLLRHSVTPLISKTRMHIRYGGLTIELDQFHLELDGLVVAEVEFPTTRYPFSAPAWFGKEVTGDSRYSNAALAASQKIPE